ncbi:RagB/SusD family nutrient uptake outer membrane protein [Chitinophaga nivalis]|uniref:RagB/SusD family nutrient uptake outer membrane protein n=1 Tax=Chitinophaga nivalis TaxID=2991709 RepID=A0ABT3IGJ2_9BACT|nr:RagB/SusD family nutrient uptake outer membrane protein [Chitinophaga nivalis]MCW3483061.1 RagB/SusD family nutrient uptake outer membrane protein [Chitinophaga nivalis]
MGPPLTNVDSQSAYANDISAASVLGGLYGKMKGLNGDIGLSVIGGLSADELTLNTSLNTLLQRVYINSLLSKETPLWNSFYYYIFVCNSALEGIAASNGMTNDGKSQLTGEAKFARAFIYFHLVNYFGDVPLITGTNYNTNASAPRSPVSLVYQQIISDLTAAQSLLSEEYKDADATSVSSERVRPNKWAATALLARTYLYTGDWKNAEIQANSIIENKALYDTIALANIFLKNSRETIWQLQPVDQGYNTLDGYLFVMPDGPNNIKYITLSDHLYQAFETGDQRKTEWVGNSNPVGGTVFHYPNKYKIGTYNILNPITEYLMVLRLGEQYLILAEAAVRQGNLPLATRALNVIRKRARLSEQTFNNKEELLKAVFHEREIELFAEMGHRWLDLKRAGYIDSVMTKATPVKGGNWQTYHQLFPLPIETIQLNPSLTGHQNPGY